MKLRIQITLCGYTPENESLKFIRVFCGNNVRVRDCTKCNCMLLWKNLGIVPKNPGQKDSESCTAENKFVPFEDLIAGRSK